MALVHMLMFWCSHFVVFIPEIIAIFSSCITRTPRSIRGCSSQIVRPMPHAACTRYNHNRDCVPRVVERQGNRSVNPTLTSIVVNQLVVSRWPFRSTPICPGWVLWPQISEDPILSVISSVASSHSEDVLWNKYKLSRRRNKTQKIRRVIFKMFFIVPGAKIKPSFLNSYRDTLIF